MHTSLVLDGSLHYLQCVPYAEILQIVLLFSMIWNCRIQSPACPNNEMYGDAVLAIRFRYQLAIFGMRVLIWLSRLIHAHSAYEIDTDKIITAFCRISYCLRDFIRLNSMVGYVRTTRCTMIWFSMIDSDINWLCLKCVYSRGYLDSLILILHMK